MTMPMASPLPSTESQKIVTGPVRPDLIENMWPPGLTYRQRYDLSAKKPERTRASRPRRESRSHDGTIKRSFASVRGRN